MAEGAARPPYGYADSQCIQRRSRSRRSRRSAVRRRRGRRPPRVRWGQGSPGADLGGLAGLGEAASVGGLSVPPNWGWAATGLPAMLGGVPLTLPGIGLGATGGLPPELGFPLMFGGLPRAAAAGAAGAVAGAAGAKYLPRLNVVARSPGAGYSAESAASPIREISGARRIPDKRTRAPRIPAGHRVPADQRTCAVKRMTGGALFVQVATDHVRPANRRGPETDDDPADSDCLSDQCVVNARKRRRQASPVKQR